MDKKSSNFKLKKKEILRGNEKFNSIFKNGDKLSGHFVSIFYLRSESRKIGFVVAKKVKTAVMRNRFKRILREIYRLNKDKFPEKLEIILYAKGTNDNFSILQKEIAQLLNKIHYI